VKSVGASNQDTLAKLELPRRWELLEQRAQARNVDPFNVVERVDVAAEHIDSLLYRVRSGGGGIIEVIFGLSGSGKTTFLRSLPRFFTNISVKSFPNDTPLSQLPEFIRNGYEANSKKQRIILIERRDNPKKVDLDQVEDVFSDLLDLFREREGEVVVLWPITQPDSARFVSETAWQVGRDSLVDLNSHGQFSFSGLPKDRFATITDNTSRNLNGDGLSAFGISEEVVLDILPDCQTISDFFGAVDARAESVREKTWSVLKERAIVHCWIVLPGDEVQAINSTASALTQGIRSRIDIDAIGEFIDRPGNETLYVKNWRKKRSGLAHLLRAVDVRFFSFPPNVALAAVRRYGSPQLKALLNQASVNLESAKDAMKASRLYKTILNEIGVETSAYAGGRNVAQETVEEYIRIQRTASTDDKPLNKAVGSLLAECLKDDAPDAQVINEKRSIPGCALKPDIQVKISDNEYICLETTWRSSGQAIKGVPATQNTLTEAHMKKYVLEKSYDYVDALGLIQ
jgi:hypothetical protein